LGLDISETLASTDATIIIGSIKTEGKNGE
jgi:hypothetical protein